MDPNRDHVGNDSIIITQFNVSNAIKDRHEHPLGKEMTVADGEDYQASRLSGCFDVPLRP